MKCLHRTSPESAASILQFGFDLSKFGDGAGAGHGEPAGVFVSQGDGGDFARENDVRGLSLGAVLELEISPGKHVVLDDSDRIARFKECRLQFLSEKFGISREDAQAVASCKTRILNVRPDLEKISAWLEEASASRELAEHFSSSLQREGIDAVSYRDPWQRVEQLIILDPRIIQSVKIQKKPSMRP